MDLKQLRTFRAVAELGSLSKAADRLRAAQPALSRHIKLLEHELRVELFVSNGRGLILIRAGRMLRDRISVLIRPYEQVCVDRQRRTHVLGPEQAEAGRAEMAGEAEADPAEHLARLAGAAGEGAGARETEARRDDRGGFLSRPDQPDGGRARLHAVAALRDP